MQNNCEVWPFHLKYSSEELKSFNHITNTESKIKFRQVIKQVGFCIQEFMDITVGFQITFILLATFPPSPLLIKKDTQKAERSSQCSADILHSLETTIRRVSKKIVTFPPCNYRSSRITIYIRRNVPSFLSIGDECLEKVTENCCISVGIFRGDVTGASYGDESR